MLDVGQAQELKLAFRREGSGERVWTNERIKKLCEQKGLLSQVLDVIDGTCEIKPITIDFDANPFTPKGWSVETHRKGGQWTFDPSKVKLHCADGQKNGKCLKGTVLREELEKLECYNANLLDFYLARPDLIPENWKGKAVFFWGTIYRHAGGFLYVRYLYWNGGAWCWYCNWLDYVWYEGNPAAVCGE